MLDPDALPSGMRCGLADSTVHLAWLVHHVLEGVRGTNWPLRSLCRLLPPTPSRRPWCILLLNCSDMSIAILHIRLLILPLVEDVVVVVEVGAGVVEVVLVALHLAPLAPIGT